MWDSILIFVLFTIIFFYVISINAHNSRCNESNDINSDGNGYNQYKGRGKKCETIDVLLSRIDWLAKKSENNSPYTTSYIICYAILLAVIFILYAYSYYILSPWEMILILFSGFIIVFSILNLFQFHTDKYPNYYIRKNIDYISRNYNIPIYEPPEPLDSKIAHRTKVHDVLNK